MVSYSTPTGGANKDIVITAIPPSENSANFVKLRHLLKVTLMAMKIRKYIHEAVRSKYKL